MKNLKKSKKNKLSLKNTVETMQACVITGASSGIGHALALHFFNINPTGHLFNLSRTKPEGFSTFEAAGRFTHIPCNLEDAASTAAAYAHVVGALESLEIEDGEDSTCRSNILLINNSGFGAYGQFPSPGVAHHQSMLKVNVEAPLTLTDALLPILKIRGGGVINIASTAAFQPTPYLGVYGATKAFVANWGLSLNEELNAGHNKTGNAVHVLTLCPGPTGSNFFARAGFESRPSGTGPKQTAQAVARETYQAFNKCRALHVCGLSNRFLVFCQSCLPRTLATRMAGTLLRRVRT